MLLVPCMALLFMGMAKADSNSKIDEILQSGLDMIVKRGKATVGEKTMVDVWTPVIAVLSAGQLTQEVIDKVVNATKDLLATKGRASYVGERSLGHIDPGSFSSGLLFTALLELGWFNGNVLVLLSFHIPNTFAQGVV